MAASKPKRYRVIPHEQGSTLRNMLARRVAELDRESAAKLIRAGGVYVNKLRVRLPQVLVAAGERVTIYLEALDAEPLDPERLVFVHREADFVVLDKPAGIPVAPTRETAVGCLSEALIHKLAAEGVPRPYVGVVHRLDRGASGLVLFTIRSVANKSIHKQFVEHSIRRRYRIRVRPLPGRGAPPAEVRCEAALVKHRDGGVVIAEPGTAGAQLAVSQFRYVAEVPPLAGGAQVPPLAGGAQVPPLAGGAQVPPLAGGAEVPPLAGGAQVPSEHLMDVELETGRTHQIRAHAAHLGFPVVGDHRYGGPGLDAGAGAGSDEGDGAGDGDEHGDGDELERLCLHAWTLDFSHPLTGAAIHLEAALPDWATVER
jgi:23S rRNA-/tRNA-specific pseudouridylate synthase